MFVGPNGVGKTMFARNLAYTSVNRGWATRYVTASDMLTDLASFNGATLRARLKRYVAPRLLVVDLCAAPGYVESGARSRASAGCRSSLAQRSST